MSELHKISNPELAELDIIFIHGMNGHPIDSWSYQKEPNEEFWLTWLAAERSKTAVFSLEYAASSNSWLGDAMPINDRSMEILATLYSSGVGSRPIMFVCYDVGGILVKSVLRQSTENEKPSIRSISEQTKSIVFIDTPHSGSNLATWIDRIGKLFKSTSAIKELKRDAPLLQNLNQWYRHYASNEQIDTHVFYASRKTNGLVVVDAASADPGIPGATPIPLDADHISISKPESPKNLLYVYLLRIVDDFLDQEDTKPIKNQDLEGVGHNFEKHSNDDSGSRTHDDTQDSGSIQAENQKIDSSEILFIGDSPSQDEDFLNRSEIAFILAARLNRVWHELNTSQPKDDLQPGEFDSSTWTGLEAEGESDSASDSFVLHIDAPWGGGKTTFANYLTRILNPYKDPDAIPNWLAQLPLNHRRFWPDEFRMPWHVVTFNAWQHQHVDPPWWCFYQSIRQQCFQAVKLERPHHISNRNSKNQSYGERHNFLPEPNAKYSYGNLLVRISDWFGLWCSELIWRIFSPKNVMVIFTFLLTYIAAMGLYRLGVFDPKAIKGAFQGNIDQIPAGVATILIVALGGAATMWSAFSAFAESIIPGTPNSARNYAMGAGDPLERFRKHFSRLMLKINRPVIVIVDDIDRCSPEFIVELSRGIQTILKSPRVFFVLLGDRDWIEQAFTSVHKKMEGIDVGSEHTFGGRFVEKAIQLSLVLPDVSEELRSKYVKSIIGRGPQKSDARSDLFLNQAETIDAAIDTNDPLERDEKVALIRQGIDEDQALSPEDRESVTREVDKLFAMRSAADEKSMEAIRHRLAPIAEVLPPNPRQIKRIINCISLFQEVGRISEKIVPGSEEWEKLARWIVLMVEWPVTWTTLSKNPKTIDAVFSQDLKQREHALSGEAVSEWVESIRSNADVMKVLDFSSRESDWMQTRINSDDIERLRIVLPAASSTLLPS